MQILKFNELTDVPWRNGGGTTRNIAQGIYLGHSAWTISRADVGQDGPFSDFSGMTRLLTVVSGGAMTLSAPNISLVANLWKPVRFDGALKIQSHLKDGPLTDLNLMFDPKFCDGNVVTRQGPLDQMTDCPGQGLLAYHILSGTPDINGTHLGAGDTVFIDAASARLSLGKDDALLEIQLTYLNQSEAIKLCIAD